MRRLFPEQHEEYLGNMWGWRFSIIGLVLIVMVLALMSYRHFFEGVSFQDQVNEPFRQEQKKEQ